MAALTNTTLAADLGANDTIVKLTSTSGYPAVGSIAGANNTRIQIDGEFMYHVRTIASGTIEVRSRGADGTVAVAHDILAPVSMGAPADFPLYPNGAIAPRPPNEDEVATVGEDATVAAPMRDTLYLINKATAAAITLSAPTVAQNGRRVTFTSQTAAAHVITGVFEDGTTGGSTTATFAAFKGATVTFVAANGLWNVVGVMTVTIT